MQVSSILEASLSFQVYHLVPQLDSRKLLRHVLLSANLNRSQSDGLMLFTVAYLLA